MSKLNAPADVFYEKIKGYSVNSLASLFSFKKDLIVLNSSMLMKNHGEYSYICFDAFATFMSKGDKHFWNNKEIEINHPFDFINEKLKEFRINKNKQLPCLQGGAVGYFGYEANHYLENLPKVIDNIYLPDIYLNFYGTIIQFDHKNNDIFIVSTGFPEKEEKKRIQYAKKNIEEIKRIILTNDFYQNIKTDVSRSKNSISSNFTQESYIAAVNDMKQYILNGDIFEANLSQKFKGFLENNYSALDLYWELVKINPSPYSAFIKIIEKGYIISASPERFIKVQDAFVETYPIKGTRKRSLNEREDRQLAKELLLSEKDHAENVMIVDLMRNDLSKVCKPGSIHVKELCALKSYKTVHHLVSKITGYLKEENNSIDLLKAAFPPGSITGAPKIRAMEIISELENETRGPYCGCIGYISFTGDMDTSVTIRTYFTNNNSIYFSAGGAIVLDSDPEEEYFESLTKAKALIQALS